MRTSWAVNKDNKTCLIWNAKILSEDITSCGDNCLNKWVPGEMFPSKMFFTSWQFFSNSWAISAEHSLNQYLHIF